MRKNESYFQGTRRINAVATSIRFVFPPGEGDATRSVIEHVETILTLPVFPKRRAAEVRVSARVKYCFARRSWRREGGRKEGKRELEEEKREKG